MVRGVRLMALVCLWLAPLLILYTALASNWVSTWETFAVPSMSPPFMDLCAITNGVKVQQPGGDPLINNPATRGIELYLIHGSGCSGFPGLESGSPKLLSLESPFASCI
jgi:hypothetical protein